ncbi:MAG: UDP-N-acetylmuramate:L-alanyl-gamma-D-glutamyl-meso-diaminopimelate ligase [Pseudomonadales bacterium]|nr:UDP-N-acetylmuramate:L-alanyl-gamma-D-glutamyl-meso-diaminopimelate ligase [Pseudomonadales bacterium]MDG1444251.1 UDP-N-acetylmuramate:L-alanyl-gamma-D-glutamyl-meso-diaminopimelate ligase [Pseudomonadales bacterium]
MQLHILGICGTLMGSIALLAKELGHNVTGSDENVYPPMSDQLSDAGINISSPYSADNIPRDTDLVMIGNANLPRGNPAVEHVLEKNIPYTSGAEWLGRYLLHDKWVIAVAGTHGKTTTTSMTAWILEYAGLKPGFLVGGVPANFGHSARLGETDFFVIEADEYDTSYFDRRSKFLHYHPRTAIFNNLEYDHADIFPDLAAIQNQFHLLVRTIPGEGLIIHPSNDENVDEVLSKGCWSKTLSFGAEHDSKLAGNAISKDHSHFSVSLNDTDQNKVVGEINWPMTGLHNMNNALAAIAAARHVGISPAIACEALSQFTGVKRRMEVIYQSPEVIVYDDFAHHPTAIETTLDGLRKQVDAQTILAIVEPGSHTMKLGIHADTLADSVSNADEVIWFKPANIKWDIDKIIDSSTSDTQMSVVNSQDVLLDAIVTRIKSGAIQHVVIMSNSGFGGLHRRLVTTLESTS